MNFVNMVVSPEQAALWLKGNVRNRPLANRTVAKYAKEMQAGEWTMTAEAIKFTSGGTLVDGQHRLHAVVAAGVPVMMTIAFGVDDPKAFEKVDGGKVRNVPDLLYLRDNTIKDTKIHAAIARRLLHWDNTADKSQYNLNMKVYKDQSQTPVLDYSEAHRDEIQNMIEATKSSVPYKRCKSASSLCAALILCQRANRVAADIFIDQVKSGRSNYSGISLLRDRLLSRTERTDASWDLEIMALTIKTFNKGLHNAHVKLLRWSDNEGFPTPGIH